MGAHVRTTAVPARAAELMVKVPPNDSALSRMMARPSWPAVASRGVKPTPSSSITSRTPALVLEKLTRARLAPECLATLFNASCAIR